MKDKLILVVMTLILLACSEKDQGEVYNQTSNHKTSQTVGVEYYTCSMHPEVHLDHPGVCPICKMDLIPKKSSIIPMEQYLDHLVKVKDTSIVFEKQLYGKLVWNEEMSSVESSWIGGEIKKWKVKRRGQRIYQGQILGMIYSEDFDRVLNEISNTNDSNFIRKRKTILYKWGLNDQQIEKAIQHPQHWLEIRSHSSGIVNKILVGQGSWIQKGASLLELESEKQFWLEMIIDESEVTQVEVGDSILAVNVYGDTNKIKIQWKDSEIENGELKLYSRMNQSSLTKGMRYRIIHQKSIEGIFIPKSAFLIRGSNPIVFLKEGNKLVKTKIQLGESFAQWQKVKTGLRESDQILEQGLFRYDAAQQLNSDQDPSHGGHH